MKLPARLTMEWNCQLPRWTCFVSDGIGTANGGFWRGFKTHAEMTKWLDRNGYEPSGQE